MSFKMTLDNGESIYPIRSYGENGFDIGNETYNSSVIVSPSKLISNWQVDSIEDIEQDSILDILKLQPEIVIFGTGKKLLFPEISKFKALINNNIGYEFMDTMAACRSYSILMSEGRKVAAALIHNADQP